MRKRTWRLMPLVLAAAVGRAAAPPAVAAAGGPRTVTVTTTADAPSPCAPSSVSLRCALAGADRLGSDVTIAFSIPSSDPGCAGAPMVCTIRPTSALPPLTASDTVVDGYTQPGTAPNDLPLRQGDDARIAVRVEGGGAPEGTSGLVVAGARDTVRGLSITGFVTCFVCTPIPGVQTGGSGIEVRGADAVVAGNFIGLLPDGVTAAPNQFAGVDVTGTSVAGARVGGADAASTNVLSGNRQCTGGDCEGFGAYLEAGDGAVVQRNLIGTTASGRAALPNAATGLVALAPNAVITGNVIGGSGGDGVLTGGTGVALVENLIGTDATGTAAIENQSHGVDVQAAGNILRGNVISGSGDTGLVISGQRAIVQGNRIGTDVTGTKALGNGFDPSAIFLGQPINGTDGMVLCGGNNTVGGTRPGQGNLVSANRGDGIFVGSGSNTIQGNRVGTNAAGTAPLPNRADGIGGRALIFVGVGFCQQAPSGFGSSKNTIGGSSPSAGNLVSGNAAAGIDLVGASDDVIARNRVGTDATGTAALGNGTAGIVFGAVCEDEVCTPSSRDRVEANLVSGNGGDGIDVAGQGGGTGIVLAGNGVGVDASGGPALGNAGAGILIGGSASGDVIGGSVASDANVVVRNGGPGIQIGTDGSDSDTHVAVEGNSTFANGGLGIDLAPAGAIDCSTSPPGPNDHLPCPIITSATASGVAGTACPGCTVEAFVALPGTDDAGHGEGAVFLGRVLAASNGAWSLTVPSGALTSGGRVTATATAPAGVTPPETSEFAANLAVS